jgi:polyisoprenoid-binding protein YceI
MKRTIVLLACMLVVMTAGAQKYFTKNGNISFFSTTSMEDIKADNNQVMCVLNTQTGELQFSMLVKSFHFQKALMEEHFNENYMESNKFPKASFKGNIADLSKVNFTKDGVYNVSVSGDMTIHGVTKRIVTNGSISVNGGKLTANAKFPLKVSDFEIAIPKLVKNNIAEAVDVTVNCSFEQKM